MKKRTLSALLMCVTFLSFGQGSTTGSPIALTGGSGMTVKIDTNATTVTLTLTGPNTAWFGIGFGGSSMGTATDMFIWNSSTKRDYTPNGYGTPIADATSSWNVTETTTSGVVTIVATRPLASPGNFTFVNNTTPINIISAKGAGTTTLGPGAHATRGPQTLTRSVLGVEDFSLAATAVYPNPSNGNFNISAKSGMDKINVYTQVGAFVKTIELPKNSLQAEVSLNGFQTGIYLIELEGETGKAWKKIVVNN